MNELPAVYEGSTVPEIFIARDPKMVVAEAENAAKVLMSVVSRKPKKVMINNEQYLEFEDWQTVAKFYGCTVKVRGTNFLDFGGVKGFEAFVDVLDREGRVISSGESMCLNDEDRWSARPKYEWKSGSRVKVGDEPVPLFQLRSMAQTRAGAKALRNVFSWVVVLAGYAPVAAEEMTGNEQGNEGKPPIQPPQEKKQEAAPAGDHITQPQGKMLFAKFKGKGYATGTEMNAAVAEWYATPGLELFKLPANLLEDCKNRIDAIGTEQREPGQDDDIPF